MARNRYFNQYTPIVQEQSLVEDLIVEAIKIYGIEAYYLPRTHVNLDKLYGEDSLMYFDDAIALELYVKSYDGFMGQQDFIAKFGLQIDESITFSMAQKRFLQLRRPSILTEYSYNMLLEDGNQLVWQNETDSINDGRDLVNYDYSDLVRPREGDLIWIPLMNFMYEIKFVENAEAFYQLGKLYTFEIRCERYQYSSEKLDTDFESIDTIENEYSMATDVLDELLAEDGVKLLLEDETTIIIAEGDFIEDRDPRSDNDFIEKKILDDDIIDFSEKNPFASVRVY
jgi:hypothetical protein